VIENQQVQPVQEPLIDTDGGVFEGPSNPPRFDAPLKLENRGVTKQKSQAEAEDPSGLEQFTFWSKQTILKNSVAAKLRVAGMVKEADTLEKCHTQYTFAVCNGCHKTQRFPNRCDLFFCPECQPRLANERRRTVTWWSHQARQPKHVTLTVTNTASLTTGHVQEFRKWFTALRRSVFAKDWVGGFYSFEVTKESSKWHLHLHALIDARWIDQLQLSEKWRKITNGYGYIVRVKDARGQNYLSEVTKYAVKGIMLATWTPAEIATFVTAFKGVRTFGVFGSLYGLRTEFADFLRSVRESKPRCECGCNEARYYSEFEYVSRELVPTPDRASIPPPVPSPQPEFRDFVRPMQPR
jgi:hypothetical protein